MDETRLKENWKTLPAFTEDKEDPLGKDEADKLLDGEGLEKVADPLSQIDWDVGDAAALEKRLIGELLGLEAVSDFFFFFSFSFPAPPKEATLSSSLCRPMSTHLFNLTMKSLRP